MTTANADTHHQTFANPEEATRWINSQPKGVQVITSSTDSRGRQVIYYRKPKDAKLRQLEALARRIEEHIAYDADTRRRMGYYKTVVDLPAAQFSLVWNSTRNLKCFENSGVTHEEALQMVQEDLGYVVSGPMESRLKFGCRAVLILQDDEE